MKKNLSLSEGLPGILHLYGLSPVWVLMCCWRWDSWVNFRWQISHLYGLIPRWILVCCER